jgi:hypothetical protein
MIGVAPVFFEQVSLFCYVLYQIIDLIAKPGSLIKVYNFEYIISDYQSDVNAISG